VGAGPSEYRDHRALLDDPRVDAVVIVTPNHTHRAVLEDALATSKHIGRLRMFALREHRYPFLPKVGHCPSRSGPRRSSR